jgi:hypothetical protein
MMVDFFILKYCTRSFVIGWLKEDVVSGYHAQVLAVPQMVDER